MMLTAPRGNRVSGPACISSSRHAGPPPHYHDYSHLTEGKTEAERQKAHSLLTISRAPRPTVGHDPPQQDNCLQMWVPSAGAKGLRPLCFAFANEFSLWLASPALHFPTGLRVLQTKAGGEVAVPVTMS